LFVTAIPGMVGMKCDAIDPIDAGFGETYVASEDMIQGMEESFEVNLQYKVKLFKCSFH